MPKNYVLNAEPGHFKITGGDAEFRITVTTTAIRTNWLLLVLYALVTLAGLVGSYFTNGWVSVALSAFVAAVTFGIGYYMIQQVSHDNPPNPVSGIAITAARSC